MSNPSSPLPRQSRSWITRFIDALPTWLESTLGGNGRFNVVWLMLIGWVFAIPIIVTPLSLAQQGLLAVSVIGLGWLLVWLEQRQSHQSHQRSGERLHLVLVWLSILVTLRYLYYRTFSTLNLDGWLDATFSLLLYGAELYAIMTLLLAYMQTLRIRERQPIDMTAVPGSQWPQVDIYIPTYNEEVDIVRKTALAALAVDYPADKKEVYILDDGRKDPARRERLRQICYDLGCHLMTRDNNDHAKAGNINHAMLRTEGELILILDCDHIPSRCILQHTVGFFLNPKVSLVQTPHWFYNPDPFERNLLTQGQVPVSNELFYKVLQKGNDFWNAAFFCGSAAIIRKNHLLEVGGIAVETVTEDCHTSLRLHSKGYETVYYDKVMVAGLAPEKFSAYVGQQVRWARGMAQILRLEWPLFNRKLTLPQRICYTSATTHFFFGFPRLMYALAPMAFLLFGINPVRGLGLETLTYALPSIILALNANFIVYKEVRFSFWNEIFEYALAFQDGLVTFMALLNPRLGSFNVTEKGLQVTRRSFDWSSVKWLLVICFLSLVSLAMVPYWLISGLQDSDAVLINATWCVVNIGLLIAALVVALEQPQLRQAHRLARQLTAVLHSGNETFTGTTLDISESGAQIVLHSWPNLADHIDLEIHGDTVACASLRGRITRVIPHRDDQVLVAVAFEEMTPQQRDDLTLVIYSDVNEWYSQKRVQVDSPFQSLFFLFSSLMRALRDPKPAEAMQIRKRVQASAQLYTQGYYVSAIAGEINSRTLQLLLPNDRLTTIHPEILEPGQPVGLLVSSDKRDESTRLIAQVDEINRTSDAIVLELSFPQVLDVRQKEQINYLLQTLPG
ncbi:MAG: UDP-forming cellulose synthase catalytic subunit [Leptolyngbya sp. SIO1E4]|nr:UDP-forming cellulose synthase catalytic subunit [Leptolyngbya sp. SIO1E4]